MRTGGAAGRKEIGMPSARQARHTRQLALAALGVALAWSLPAWSARFNTREEDDARYHPAVAIPAYDGPVHPVVLVDEAHHDLGTVAGRLRAFAVLLGKDGYRVKPNRSAFDRAHLAAAEVLVIDDPTPAVAGKNGGITDAEADAVRDWVQAGGSLLFVAEPLSVLGRVAGLARRLGVDLSQGHTFDPAQAGSAGAPSTWLVYSRENGLLGEHPITRGREEIERLHTVTAFHGQSILGPEGSVAFLRLADTALDQDEDGENTPALGRAQGIAFELGKGRVVVLGDGSLLTARQVADGALLLGMNRPGNDDRQLALNVVHWLSRLLG